MNDNYNYTLFLDVIVFYLPFISRSKQDKLLGRRAIKPHYGSHLAAGTWGVTLRWQVSGPAKQCNSSFAVIRGGGGGGGGTAHTAQAADGLRREPASRCTAVPQKIVRM